MPNSNIQIIYVINYGLNLKNYFCSMKINVQPFTFNGFQENTYVVYSEKGDAVIIDPGCYESHEEKQLQDFIHDKGLSVLAVLNTHAHIDHVLGNQFTVDYYQVPLYLHKADITTLTSVQNYAHVYGFNGYKASPLPSNILEGGEKLVFGEINFDVLYTPGHAPGHVVYYNKENNFVINGDVLFNGSFGRVDLPGGDMEVLKKSIFSTMFQLPEDTIVYCGHGPETTIGKEKETNYIHNF